MCCSLHISHSFVETSNKKNPQKKMKELLFISKVLSASTFKILIEEEMAVETIWFALVGNLQ